MRHRDHAVTGNTLKSMNTGLAEYFFGRGLDQKLTFQRFLAFRHQLHREILHIEVERLRVLSVRQRPMSDTQQNPAILRPVIFANLLRVTKFMK